MSPTPPTRQIAPTSCLTNARIAATSIRPIATQANVKAGIPPFRALLGPAFDVLPAIGPPDDAYGSTRSRAQSPSAAAGSPRSVGVLASTDMRGDAAPNCNSASG